MADKPIQVLIVDDEPVCLEQSRQKLPCMLERNTSARHKTR